MPSSNVEPAVSRSFLITISAQALSSVGFGLSILAIWVQWLVPSAPTQPPTFPYHQHNPHSCPPQPITIVANGIHEESRPAKFAKKQVYFVDTPDPPLVQRNSSDANNFSSDQPMVISQLEPISLDLVHLALEKQISDDGHDTNSSRLSGRKVRKPRCPMRRLRTSPSPEEVQEQQPPLSASSTLIDHPNATKKSIHDCSVAIVDGPRPASPSEHPPRCHSSLSEGTLCGCPSCRLFAFLRKKRRVSAPAGVPRTSPYEAPYFAAPPLPAHAGYDAPRYVQRPATDSGISDHPRLSVGHKPDVESTGFVSFPQTDNQQFKSRRPFFQRRRSPSLDTSMKRSSTA